MTNPAINSVIRSQEYWRLKEVVDSPGFIREIDESALAVYIGPDSDIAEAKLVYFNPDVVGGLETAVVSVNGPFVGRLDSLPKTQVPTTGQPARMLVSPVDLVDNSFSLDSGAMRSFNVPAVLDLIVALKRLPDIPSVRADRTLRFPSVPYNTVGTPPDDDGSTDLFVPIYGRRMVTVTAIGNGVDVSLSLVTLIPGQTTVPRFLGTYTIPITIPALRFARTAVIRASDASRYGDTYDLAPAPTGSYFESDAVGGPPTIDLMSPQARGMADLLYIHIAAPAGAIVDVTKFVDIFVKVADKET